MVVAPMNLASPVASPAVLARVRSVPTRLVPAIATFGGMLGVPTLLSLIGAFALSVDAPVVGVTMLLLAALAFAAMVILAWVFIFQASGRLQRAEQALYAGDFESATRDALFVTKTVYRSDYQTGALFTLALAAERIGAFSEAAGLFSRALDMIPAMAAQRPGRRARSLFAAHAAIDFAASNDGARAHAMLARCYQALGQTGQPGAFDALLDDSYMGSVGINTILLALENRREPRPLAVLAFKDGQLDQVLQAFGREAASIQHGLAPHEHALAMRLNVEALRLASNAGPHRSPGDLVPAGHAGADAASWAMLVVPPPR